MLELTTSLAAVRALSAEDVTLAQTQLAANFAARADDRRVSSFRRCADLLISNTSAAATTYIDRDHCRVFHPALIDEAYTTAPSCGSIDVLVAGSAPMDAVRTTYWHAFDQLGLTVRPPVHAVRRRRDTTTPHTVIERLPTQQAHPVIGYAVSPAVDQHASLANQLVSLILGGNARSLQYQELRQRLGLAYTTYAWYEPLFNLGFAYAEVNSEEQELAVSMMVTLLERIRAGNFDDEHIRLARDTFLRYLCRTAAPGPDYCRHIWQTLPTGGPPALQATIELCRALTSSCAGR